MGRPIIKLREIIGWAYDDFWNDKHEFRALKGSRGSGKSKIAALNLIYRMMNYPEANALVVRRFYNSLRDSCYADLLWAINRFKVNDMWSHTTAPMRFTYKPTGQVILFGGMDNVDSITSISVTQGVLCWCWIEEAYQLGSEEDFDKLYFSIRGKLPDGYFKQITLTFNPWSEHTWLKTRFFDKYVEDPISGEMIKNDLSNVFTKTTTYRDNEFLTDTDRQAYERLSITNPRRARVVCDGEWGVAEGLIYDDWEVKDFDIYDVMRKNKNIRTTCGLDFGFTISYNAFVSAAVDVPGRTIWVWDEMYERGLSNLDIAKRITEMGYGKEEIWADSAVPKDIYTLKTGSGCVEESFDENGEACIHTYSLPNIQGSLKGADSVLTGIKQLQSFHMIVHPRCKNFETELLNYSWDVDKDGKNIEKPVKDYDHLCLDGDSLIDTIEGRVRLRDITKGCFVLTRHGYREVLEAMQTSPEENVMRLEFSDGSELRCTKDHPLWCVNKQEFVAADKISDTALLLNDMGESVHLTYSCYDGTCAVYNLYVSECHEFFANGILVSNCDALRYAMTKFFIGAHGKVVEAKGGATSTTTYKSRRVVATITR